MSAEILLPFEELLQQRVVVLDGAMGTMVQRYRLSEAEFRGFYDCIGHNVVRGAFKSGCVEFQERGIRIDPRAIAIFDAFLDGFSFERIVLGQAESALRQRQPDAEFPWPIDALRELHGDGSLGEIGVCQGSSISTVMTNLILDRADRAVIAAAARAGSEIFYGRYCDDMIIVSPGRGQCYGGVRRILRSVAAAEAANARAERNRPVH